MTPESAEHEPLPAPRFSNDVLGHMAIVATLFGLEQDSTGLKAVADDALDYLDEYLDNLARGRGTIVYRKWRKGVRLSFHWDTEPAPPSDIDDLQRLAPQFTQDELHHIAQQGKRFGEPPVSLNEVLRRALMLQHNHLNMTDEGYKGPFFHRTAKSTHNHSER